MVSSTCQQQPSISRFFVTKKRGRSCTTEPTTTNVVVGGPSSLDNSKSSSNKNNNENCLNHRSPIQRAELAVATEDEGSKKAAVVMVDLSNDDDDDDTDEIVAVDDDKELRVENNTLQTDNAAIAEESNNNLLAAAAKSQADVSKQSSESIINLLEDDDNDVSNEFCEKQEQETEHESTTTTAPETNSIVTAETTQLNNVEQQQQLKPEVAPSSVSNIFAQFAFQSASASSTTERTTENFATKSETTIKCRTTVVHSIPPRAISLSTKSLSSSSSKKNTTSTTTKKKKQKTQQCPKVLVKMKDLKKEEQDSIVQKWHSFVADEDEIEVRRFQLVIAARLHAQCQKSMVTLALQKLRTYCKDHCDGKPLTAQTIVNHLSIDDIKSCITNVNMYPTKAKHILEASHQIISIGGVPEEESHLLKLTGIGPVYADLLGYVNTASMHREQMMINNIDEQEKADISSSRTSMIQNSNHA